MLFKTIAIIISAITVPLSTFSEFDARPDLLICSVLHEKCEWKQNWKRADGIRRDLYFGQPKTQFYYFCRENSTENCEKWVDENGSQIEGTSEIDGIVNGYFVIPNMSLNVTGSYRKIPEEKSDLKLIIE
ncbi:unnamed protein product [Caenorhabditis bovis]|uniref:Uncharacterized protein n=1 Tax=Caenorhabditis bovis TaxID=2654633 RepID=A0A8S1EVM6_9PELO|nr:unnamed protein product [Caenorhabditis bovis]